MADRYLTDAEVRFLRGLTELGVRFMVVGMGAAVLQGADRGTEDIDLWFSSLSDQGIGEAARRAGGVFAWRASPPMISGRDLDDIDIVWRCDGLGSFEDEYASAVDVELSGIKLKALSLDRVIASKEAAARPKDKAALPSLRAALVALKRGPKAR